MRRLITADVFAAARAVKQAGLREKLKATMLALSQKEELPDVESVGVDTLLDIVEAFTETGAEKAVYALLARPFEIPPEEVELLPLDALVSNLDALAHDPALPAFFKAVSGMIGKN